MKIPCIQPKQSGIRGLPQRGSALIISLFILLVMTLIGIASLNTSLLEEKMSLNTQLKTASFQDAEAAIDFAIHELEKPTDTYLKQAIDNANQDLAGPNIVPSTESTINGNVSLTYIRNKLPAGYSMDKYSSLLVEFSGTGKPPPPHDTGNITTTNIQGVLRHAPKP